MKVLAIEAANPPGSIAILSDGETAVFRQLANGQRTTETFAGDIQAALRSVSWGPRDIDLVATTRGPGSFTGLRIGVTAAKVFAYAMGKPAIGINTLKLIAMQCPQDGEVEAVFDAQRGELFAARFAKSGDTLTELLPTKIIHADEWISSRAHNASLVGPGLKKIVQRLPQGSNVVDDSLWVPRADVLGQMATRRFQSEENNDPMQLVPEYFRKSAAEEKAEIADRAAGETSS